MPSYFVYAIFSETGHRIYVGMSVNPEKRLMEHNLGKTKSTKAFIPWKLFFVKEFESRIEARLNEKYFKTGAGKSKLKFLLSK